MPYYTVFLIVRSVGPLFAISLTDKPMAPIESLQCSDHCGRIGYSLSPFLLSLSLPHSDPITSECRRAGHNLARACPQTCLLNRLNRSLLQMTFSCSIHFKLICRTNSFPASSAALLLSTRARVPLWLWNFNFSFIGRSASVVGRTFLLVSLFSFFLYELTASN